LGWADFAFRLAHTHTLWNANHEEWNHEEEWNQAGVYEEECREEVKQRGV